MASEQEPLGLTNICGGAVDGVFQRELQNVINNIGDVNTDAEATRKISLEFTIKPFKDRSGAQVSFVCKSRSASVQPKTGTVYLHRRGVEMVAVPHDPRQARMFDGKAAAAGDKPH